MELSLFINSLLASGTVHIMPEFHPPPPEDLSTAVELLRIFHEQDSAEMPANAPAFDKEAAIWAASYFYQAVQLTVNRQVTAEEIGTYLKPFPGVINIAAVYSADIVLRNLPMLMELAKGLAPGDPLLEHFKRTAITWPFSSVGIDLNERKNEELILSHPSLRQEYIDRIISKKDKIRATDKMIRPLIMQTTGEYTPLFWPEFEKLTSEP